MTEETPPQTSLWSRIDSFARDHWVEGAIGVFWVWLLVTSVEPMSRNESHNGRLALSVLGAVMTVAYVGRHKVEEELRGQLMRLWRLIAMLAILFGSLNYYQFNRDWAEGFDDYTDITYYYINSKYFDELGYDKLYEAMLLADAEGPRRVVGEIRKIRSLVTYDEVRASTALKESVAKEGFSPERWTQFKHDTDWFLKNRIQRHGTRGLKRNFFVDHGYNPPPTWTLLGGALSNAVPVEQLKWITSVDLLLVLMLFIGIGWAFGPDVALITAVWYVATFSSRWPVLTHSLLRFDWVVALAAGVVALKKGKHAVGGGFLAWAALSRIFPFIFGVPVVAKMGWDFYKTRELSRPTRSFLAGGISVCIVALLGAFLYTGSDGFVGGAKNAIKHSSQYSSQKVGFGDALFFRGETTRAEMRDSPCGAFERFIGSECAIHGDPRVVHYGEQPSAEFTHKQRNGIAGKGEMVDMIEGDLRVLGIAALLLVCAYAIRSRRPLHQLPALAVLPLFVLTNPSYYYYILRIVLVLFHAENLDKRSNAAGLTWLFGMEIVSHWLLLQGVQRYTITASISWMFIAYFIIVGVLMALELREDEAGLKSQAE